MRTRLLIAALAAMTMLTACAKKEASDDAAAKESARRAQFYQAQEEGYDALQSGNFEKAVAAFQRQMDLAPESPWASYNLTCTYSRKGNTDLAFESLNRAIDGGFIQIDHMSGDPDLEPMREDPRFEEAIQRIENIKSEFKRKWDPIFQDGLMEGRSFDTLEDLSKHYDSAMRGMWQSSSLSAPHRQKEKEYRLANEKMASLKKMDWEQDPNLFSEVIRLYQQYPADNQKAAYESLYSTFMDRYPKDPAAAEIRYQKAKNLRDDPDSADEGLRELERVIETYPESTWAGHAKLDLAQLASGEGDVDRAYRLVQEVNANFKLDNGIRQRLGDMRNILFAKDGLPDPAVPDMEGAIVTLSEYEGKILMLDFWATWCRPCVAEIPYVRKAYEQFHDQGFEIVSVSLDKDKSVEELKAFCADNGMTWRHVYENKAWSDTIAGKKYYIWGIPTMILVDRKGNIHEGDRGDALIRQIETLVAE